MFSCYRNHLMKKYNLEKALIDADAINCALKIASRNFLPFDSSYYLLPKLANQILKLLRQIGKCFLLNFFRDVIIGLGYTACNGGQGVTITPPRAGFVVCFYCFL